MLTVIQRIGTWLMIVSLVDTKSAHTEITHTMYQTAIYCIPQSTKLRTERENRHYKVVYKHGLEVNHFSIKKLKDDFIMT